jgi:hypothetical protein
VPGSAKMVEAKTQMTALHRPLAEPPSVATLSPPQCALRLPGQMVLLLVHLASPGRQQVLEGRPTFQLVCFWELLLDTLGPIYETLSAMHL